MTGILQPMDVGVNGPFKARIKNLWDIYWLSKEDDSKDCSWQELINIIIQVCIYNYILYFKAWNELSVISIQKSFRTSGVFNDTKWPTKLPEPPLIDDNFSETESEISSESESDTEEYESNKEENSHSLTAFDILMSSKARNKK